MSVHARVEGDLPGLKALIRRMNEANRNVLVGVPAGAMHTKKRGPSRNGRPGKPESDPQPRSLAQIAVVHEFGDPDRNIPERPALRGGVKRGIPKFNALNRDSLREVVRGNLTVEQALGRLGAAAQGEVQREFIVGGFVPNKPETIRRKGSSRPLIDIGQYRQSITWMLEGKQSRKARVIK